MKISANDLDYRSSYLLLTSCVVPRPIAWVTTIGDRGQVNLAPYSNFTFLSKIPPMIGIGITKQSPEYVHDKDTEINIRRSGDFVVNIAQSTQAADVQCSSQRFHYDESEAAHLGLHTLPSDLIASPRLACAPVSIECKLKDCMEFGSEKYRTYFMVAEVVMFHVRDDLMSDGMIDPTKLDPLCRIGGRHYASIGQIL